MCRLSWWAVTIHICLCADQLPTPLSLLQQVEPPLSPWQEGRQNMGYRNRTAAVIDLDDMIGVVLDGLEALGDAVVRKESSYTFLVRSEGLPLKLS